ncbi:MAG: DUF2190 family protein [Janthinobacterium lividum]
MKNFIYTGESIPLVAPYNVAAGGGCLVGSLFTVAKSAALAGAVFEGMSEGVFDMAKTTGQSWTQGVKLYWDDTGKLVTTTVGSNKLIGVATQSQASGDAIGRTFVMALAA